jgi:hypothetical protein
MNPAIMATLVFGLLFCAMLVCFELGHRVGRGRRAKHSGEPPEGVGIIDGAIMGLLGLSLAFTFSGASDRLVLRRAQIVDEANAIGTAYLRIDVLPESDQPAIRDLFRRYLDARLEVFDKIPDMVAVNAALARSAALQHEIWSRSVVATRNATHPGASVIMLPALNQMIDITTTRTMAARTHAPTIVLVLLILLSLLGATLSGYAMSVQAKRNPLHIIVFALAISATVYVVLDLEFPRVGLITLKSTDQAMIQLRDLMK